MYVPCYVQEIITDIKEMVKEMMKAFYLANRKVKPERILFYRDGVSEGQFQTVSVKITQFYYDFCLLYTSTCTYVHAKCMRCRITKAVHNATLFVDHVVMYSISTD